MKTAWKALAGVAALAIAIGFALATSATGHIAGLFYSADSCAAAGSDNAWLKNSMESAIRAAVRDSGGVLLQDLTPFEWDRVFTFSPYSPDTALMSAFGFQPGLLGCTAIYVRDDVRLFVFQQRKRVVAFADVPNAQVWGGFRGGEGIDAADSWLCVEQQNDYAALSRCRAGAAGNNRAGKTP